MTIERGCTSPKFFATTHSVSSKEILMRTDRVLIAKILLALASTTTVGCDGQMPVADDDNALIALAITGTPADISCLRATVTGATRTAVRSVVATTGQAISTKLSGLPTGQVQVLLEGFGVACAAVSATSEATWLSDSIPLTLVRGVPVPLKVSMRENGRINLEVDFISDSSCSNLAASNTIYHTENKDGFFAATGISLTGLMNQKADGTQPTTGERFNLLEYAASGVRISLNTSDPSAYLMWTGSGAMLRCAVLGRCNADIVITFDSPVHAAAIGYPGNVEAIWKDEAGAPITSFNDPMGSGINFLGADSNTPIKSVTLVRMGTNFLSNIWFSACN
jgi:hypothetical protein